MMETGEIIYEKVYASPRPPPKLSFEDNRPQELDSEVAGGSEDFQETQPKSKTQLSSTERLVGEQQPLFAYQGDRKKVSCLVANAPT